MENSLTNFMLETILKIQTLTETKVFLLLESSGDGARRFCGTSDLVHSFENGALHPRPSDVEVTLDPAIGSTVIEKPQFAAETSSASIAGKKRPVGVIDDANGASDASNHGAPPIKRSNLNDDMNEMVAFDELVAVECVDVKREVEEFVIGDSDDEESGTRKRRQTAGNVFPQGLAWPEASNTMNDGNQFVPTNELSARKLEALQAIENPTAVFEKGTLENKLLSRCAMK